MVYFSSLGFVLNAHYCKEELRSTSLYLPAKSCHEGSMDAAHAHAVPGESMPAGCPMHQTAEKSPVGQHGDKSNCCDDQSQYIKQDQEQHFEINQLPLIADMPVLPPVALASVLFQTDRRSVRYLCYKPPLIVCDLPVSLQTFLC